MTGQKGHLNSDGVFIKEGDSKEPLVAENCTFALEEDSPSLQQAQNYVDGFVEVLTCGEVQVLINEEGMYRPDLRINPEATKLAVDAGYIVPERGIVGNAMVLTGKARWK